MLQASRALLLWLAFTAPLAWAAVPEWLKLAAPQQLPQYSSETTAVRLFDEQTTVVEPSGEIHTTYRIAYKLLRPNSRAELSSVRVYSSDDTRLTYLKGWAISSTGLEYEVKQKEAFVSDSSEEYTDVKEQELEIPGLDVGGVVGYEYQRRGHPLLNEDGWYFQSNIPVLFSRYRLKLPEGWTFETFWDNHERIEPLRNGNEYTWEVRNVKEIEQEPAMPAWRAVAGRMVIHFHSLTEQQKTSWVSVGAWYGRAVAGRRGSTDAMKNAVKELTANAKSQRVKMEILARWVQQNVRYVALEMGIGKYQPRFAGDIFTNRYGDCKDKATVLSALLKEVGIDSDYLLVHTVRGEVRPESPSASTFNHMILAIHVPKDMDRTGWEAVYEHPTLGTLLLFDPTSNTVPLGLLPGNEQMSYALLVQHDSGELMRTPLLPAATNVFEREAKLQIAANGVLTGRVQEKANGGRASMYRDALKQLDKRDRQSLMEMIVGTNLAGFEVIEPQFKAIDDVANPLEVEFSFSASGYTKKAGPLLLVRPRVLAHNLPEIEQKDKPRQYPVEFAGTAKDVDHYEIELPAQFEVDELPEPVDVVYDFGEYHCKVEQAGNKLNYTRLLLIKEVSVPTNRLDDLKKFYRQVASDGKNVAVLKPASASGK